MWRGNGYRCVLVSLHGHAAQETDVLLRCHHLRSDLHDRLCLLDVILAGPQVCPSSSVSHNNNSLGHGYNNIQHQQLNASCLIHQGWSYLLNGLTILVIFFQAIDVWSNMCVSFVFLALLEYALVNYAARADARWRQFNNVSTNNIYWSEHWILWERLKNK